VAHRAKMDRPFWTENQHELGARHFEGAAGGAVLLGEPPQCPAFDEHFGWPDAVVSMSWDENDPAAVFDALEGDRPRLERIRTSNILNCLRRHDWLHRWKMILDATGLAPQPGVARREQQLEDLADFVPGAAAEAARA